MVFKINSFKVGNIFFLINVVKPNLNLFSTNTQTHFPSHVSAHIHVISQILQLAVTKIFSYL